MFFEATYLASPQFSPISPDDSVYNDNFSLEEEISEHAQTEDKEEETPVNHLVFIIHGIGQQTEQYGHFYEHVDNLKETTRQVLQAKIPDHNVRIELVPIEWHRHLHDRVDPQFKRITLKSIPTIRLIENEYLADVLLYFSKDHGQAIIDNVTELFNTSYHNFMEKHPNFDGKIAILGYSLGGIVTWDILSHQHEPVSDDEKADYQKVNINFSKLDFLPDYYFTLGSPVAAVLTIRNQLPMNYHPPDSIIFENIFDAYDPLAYRLEPLYDDYYVDHPPVLVDRSMPSSVPTFSFPTLPSLPGSSLFSFFSWKMTTSNNDSNNNNNPVNLDSDTSTIEVGNKDQTITNKADKPNDNYSISKDDHIIPTNVPTDVSNNESGDKEGDENIPNSIPTAERKKSVMSSVLQYFGAKKNENNSNLSTSSSTTTITTSNNDQPKKLKTKNDDIIRWDPLHDEVLSSDNSLQLPPSSNPSNAENQQGDQNKIDKIDNNDDKSDNDEDDEDEDYETVSINTSTHRLPLQRSVTYSDQRSLQNHLDNNEAGKINQHSNDTAEKQTSIITSNITSTYSNKNNSVQALSLEKGKMNQERHHLVEVLGIDGVRIESIERANANFQRQRQQDKRASSSSMDKNKLNDDLSMMDESTFIEVNEYTQQNSEIDNNNNNNNEDKKESASNQQEQKQDNENEHENENNKDDDYSQTKHTLEKLPGQRRIDYSLQQEGFMSMIANEYLVGLRAHFSYWASKDLLWHIVRRLENLDITSNSSTQNNGTGKSSSSTVVSRNGSTDSIPNQVEVQNKNI